MADAVVVVLEGADFTGYGEGPVFQRSNCRHIRNPLGFKVHGPRLCKHCIYRCRDVLVFQKSRRSQKIPLPRLLVQHILREFGARLQLLHFYRQVAAWRDEHFLAVLLATEFEHTRAFEGVLGARGVVFHGDAREEQVGLVAEFAVVEVDFAGDGVAVCVHKASGRYGDGGVAYGKGAATVGVDLNGLGGHVHMQRWLDGRGA